MTSPSRSAYHFAREPRDPVAGHLAQALRVELVAPLAAGSLDGDQPRQLELAQVPRGGRPAALEAPGDLARGHAATVELQYQQDLAARGMCERREHALGVAQLPRGITPSQGCSAADSAGTRGSVARPAAP